MPEELELYITPLTDS